MVYDKITIKRIEHCAGMYVPLRHLDCGIVFGKILLLLSGNNSVNILVESYKSERDVVLHTYILEESVSQTECVSLEKFLDYQF